MTALVEEDVLVSRVRSAGLLLQKEFLKELRRARPDRTHAHLFALADEVYLAGRVETDIARTQIHDLLDRGASVEHQGEHRVVAPGPADLRSIPANMASISSFSRYSIGAARAASLERQAEDLLQCCHVIRMFRGEEAHQGMDSGQTRVASDDAVLAFGFQIREKSGDSIRRDGVQFQALRSAFAVHSRETREQHHPIAVAADRVRTHAPKRRQVLWKNRAIDRPSCLTRNPAILGAHDPPVAPSLHSTRRGPRSQASRRAIMRTVARSPA